MELLQIGLARNVLDAIENDAVESSVFALPANATVVEWQTVFGEAPDAIDIDILTSTNGVDFEVIETTTDVSGETGNFVTAAVFVQAIINSVTGGTTTTVILVPKQVTIEL